MTSAVLRQQASWALSMAQRRAWETLIWARHVAPRCIVGADAMEAKMRRGSQMRVRGRTLFRPMAGWGK